MHTRTCKIRQIYTVLILSYSESKVRVHTSL